MAMRFNFFSPLTIQQSQTFHANYSSPIKICFKPKTQIHCTNKRSSRESELESELASEVAKMKTHLAEREEAMKKSRELLFYALCQYLELKEDEVKKNWEKMNEQEKLVLVNGFVSEWGVDFYPLSKKHVMDMLQLHLHEGNIHKPHSSSSSLPVFFPRFKKFMGFSQNR